MVENPGWPRVRRVLGRPAVQALLVFAVSRVFTTLVLLTVWWVAQAAGLPFASYHGVPGFWQLFGGWDTAFVRRIASAGYPTHLPLDASGNVLPNAWAFFPLYPTLIAGLHLVIPLPLTMIGAAVSIAAGAGAAVVFRGFVAERVDPTRAIWATALFCFAPVAFVLQFAYAESLLLLLVFSFLWLVARQHYWATLPIGVLAAFTRPVGLTLAVLLAIEIVITWRSTRAGQRVALAVSGIVVALASLSWTVIAAVATGRPDAYLATEQSWWTGFVGRVSFLPFAPWFQLAERYLPLAGILLVIVVVTGWIFWLTRPSIRALGHVTVGFAASYSLYLFAVFLPQQSIFRVVLPLSPLLASETFTGSSGRRRTILGIFALLQFPALILLWIIGYP